MDLVTIVVLLFFIIGFFGIYVGSAAWTIRDAQKRGYDGIFPLVLMLAFGPLAAIVWLMVRPSTELVERLRPVNESAEDAMNAAVKLDAMGEWDEALALYRHTAARFPEHAAYIQECIKRVEAKQQMASKLT